MAKKRKLRQELSKFARKTEKPPEIISGALGIYIGGKQYVDIPSRPGYVFVRLRNNMSELIQAHNQTVSPIYDLPVLVVWNHNRYEIYGRDSEQYGSYWDTSSSFLPKHGFQHEFDPDNNGGGDLVFVHGEQFYPMMTFPSGTDGANTVLIAPYRYFYQGLWRYTGNTGVGDLLALGPTGANNAKLLLVGVTSATGNPFIKQGAEFSEGITGAAALTQFVPTSLTPIDEIPGAIIRLVTGTETITWANIYDARQYMGILQAGSGTGGGATNFLGLTDTPNSYSGQADKLVVVNAAENALEFRTSTGTSGGSHILTIVDDVGGLASGDNDDYTPTGYNANTDVIIVYGNADNTSRITGITGGTNGRKLTLINGSSNAVNIAYQGGGGGSSVGNTIEFNTSDGMTIRGFESLSLIWYTSLGEWSVVDERKERDTFWLAGSMTGTVTGNQNNWSLSKFNEKSVFLVSPTADRTITGINSTVGADAGHILIFVNTSPTYNLIFANEDGLSAAYNRFSMGSNVTIRPGKSAIIWFDVAAQRWRAIATSVSNFLNLSDVPTTYSGQANKFVAVNAGETALEFVSTSPGGGGGLGIYGQDEAVGLGTGTTLNVVGDDISLSISGTVLTLLHSNPTGTPHSFLDLTDTPDSYSGQGSKFVAVNSGGTALEFVASSPGGGGGSGLVIYDDSVYKVTGTAISFDSNLSVAVTGSVAFVSASGASALSNSNLTLTASGTTNAAINTRYFVDIGGMIGDSYFALPTGTAGDQIELYLVTGSASYELIVKGAAGVSINGGSTATEWSRLFINQETLKFVTNSITNWEVSYDGRIPCIGRLERITTPFVTGTANTWTLPDWNNIGLNVGNIANLAQDRFDIRRAGYYIPSGNYYPGAAITADNYCSASIWQNTTQVSTALNRPSVTSQLATVPLPTISFYANVNDYFEYRFATQENNKGIGRTDDATTNPTKVGAVYFAIKEILRGA